MSLNPSRKELGMEIIVDTEQATTYKMAPLMNEVLLHIESQRLVLGVSPNQIRRYWKQGQDSYLLKDPAAEPWWDRFAIDVKERTGVSRLDIMAEAGVGKTHALGEVAELNVDKEFQLMVLDSTDKLAQVRVIKAATTARFLREMQDENGDPLVQNRSDSWTDLEKRRIRVGMHLAIERATERLPEEEPDFKHIIAAERVTAFQGDDGIEGADIAFMQCRETDPYLQDEASMQRNQMAQAGDKRADKIYKEFGSRLDNPNLPSSLVSNRQGGERAMFAQTAEVNRRLLLPDWHNALVREEGIVPYGENDLDRYNSRRYKEIVPTYYRVWMKRQGISPLRGIVVPNHKVVAGEDERGYHAQLIETYSLDVSRYVTSEDILQRVA